MDVAGEAGEHVAMAAAVEGVRLQPLEVGEELGAQREREALADPGGRVLVAEGEQRAEQREADHGRHEDGQRAERLGHQDVVDDELEEPDLGGLDRGQQSRQRDACRERLPVRPRQRPEAPEDLPHRHGRRRRDHPIVVRSGGQSSGKAGDEGAQGLRDERGLTRGGSDPFLRVVEGLAQVLELRLRLRRRRRRRLRRRLRPESSLLLLEEASRAAALIPLNER
jgi:hypothetical protein